MGILDFFRRRLDPQRPPTTAVAMVALRHARLPDVGRLLQRLGDDWPGALREDRKDNAEPIILSVPGGWAACALMPAPIPWSELEWPAQAASWRWPDAEARLREHTAHLILHVGSSELDAIDTWLLLTTMVAAAVALTDATGVYWGASSTVHEPASFLEQVAGVSRKQLPVLIWVGVHPVHRDEGTSVFTTGLDVFERMNLEIRDSHLPPSVVLERVLEIADYCISSGRVLGDGDTIGASQAERIVIRHAPSAFLSGQIICRIEL